MSVNAVLAKVHQRFERDHFPAASATATRTAAFRPLPAAPQRWLLATFPTYFQNAQGQPIPLAPHHDEFWAWVWALRAGQAAPSFIALWPRGGGKSVSAELACAVIGYYGLRRYGLYIGNTQSQSDDHVANVATMFERLGVQRSLNTYGMSKGWRVSRLRTAEGFTLDAVGMDTAIRGVRLDESRPDILVCDDLDDQHDSPATIAKKVQTLTRKILPAGSPSMTVLGVQNLPNADGIFAQLADGRAEFLLDRLVSGPHPALRDLPETGWWERETPEGAPPRLRITAGVPTWAGQDVAACAALLTKIGLAAFLVECQHRGERLTGKLFQRQWFRIVHDWPRAARRVRAWDLASTEPRPGSDPDYTTGALLAEYQGQYTLCDMRRARLTPGGVEALIAQTAALDGRDVAIWLEQEPGSSGRTVIDHYTRTVLQGYTVHGARSTGSKVARAGPVSSAAEAGNVALLAGDWNEAFLWEAERFPGGAKDDQIDALSLGLAALMPAAEDEPKRAGTWGRR